MDWTELAADARVLVHQQDAIDVETRACDANPLNWVMHAKCMAHMQAQAVDITRFMLAVLRQGLATSHMPARM
jgi:hypothetical protein